MLVIGSGFRVWGLGLGFGVCGLGFRLDIRVIVASLRYNGFSVEYVLGWNMYARRKLGAGKHICKENTFYIKNFFYREHILHNTFYVCSQAVVLAGEHVCVLVVKYCHGTKLNHCQDTKPDYRAAREHICVLVIVASHTFSVSGLGFRLNVWMFVIVASYR